MQSWNNRNWGGKTSNKVAEKSTNWQILVALWTHMLFDKIYRENENMGTCGLVVISGALSILRLGPFISHGSIQFYGWLHNITAIFRIGATILLIETRTIIGIVAMIAVD
ncbi:hypothetical protein J3Q64DRAFT_1700637 [Phycomyces blakesleeanus]|uniref:Uncharacterized protein n=1 Tax=Phycomyces blakesleeanus TaxID=4837 RepID=A0ABR3AUA2_PHYBL